MKLEDFVWGGYAIGISLDWAYWVARGVELESGEGGEHWFGAMIGLPVSVVWPLHILVEAWFWILS